MNKFGITNRQLFASGVLGVWLLVIASRQVALFAGAGGGLPDAELLPAPVTAGVMLLALAVRIARPSVETHVACIVALVCGLALLAASLGSPFANATATYCGDFCRDAIMRRFIAFFGWPVVSGAGLYLAWRSQRASHRPGSVEQAAWSRAWILPTLVLGLAAALLWWHALLP